MIDIKDFAFTLARAQAEQYTGISVRELPSGEFEATHRSFDPDPESRWHIRGTGLTREEAIAELHAQLPQERYRSIFSSPYEPNDFVRASSTPEDYE